MLDAGEATNIAYQKKDGVSIWVAEVIVIYKLDWLDAYPSPSASNFVK